MVSDTQSTAVYVSFHLAVKCMARVNIKLISLGNVTGRCLKKLNEKNFGRIMATPLIPLSFDRY